MQLTHLIVSITLAVNTVSAFNLFGGAIKNDIAIVHGNLSAIYADSYLAPFAHDDAQDSPYELIDDHEDLVQDRQGSIVSLRKRGDDCQKYHKITLGDNCYTLSLKYNIEMENMLEWNEQINSKCTNLYPGKSYCVRKDGVSTLEKACVQTHRVTATDTCTSISKQFSITRDQFLEMNPSVEKKKCYNLLTGGNYCVKEETKLVLSTNIVNKAAKKKTSAVSSRVSRSTRRYKKTTSTKEKTSKTTTTTSEKTTTTTSVKPTTIKTTTTSSKPTTTTEKKTTTTEKTTTKPTTTTTTTTSKTTTTTTTTSKPTPTKEAEKEESASSSSDKRKLLQKGSDITYYWIAHPEDYDQGGKEVTVKTCDGKALGSVPEDYADALVMEGTGVLGNKIVNLGGCSCSNYNCFMEVDKKEDPYGLTSFGGPLRPFITIAANDIKRDTKIFVPEIVGWEIPGTSKKHNGCLLVDDRSWSFDKNHIDLYVYREKHYRTLNGEHKVSKVDIYEGGDCNLLNYA